MARAGTQLGISISDTSLEIVEVSLDKGKGVVRAFARVRFSKGVVEKGVVIDQERFVSVIQAALEGAKPKAFLAKKAVISVPDVVSYIHAFRFPPSTSKDELRGALSFQAEEIVPVDLSEAVVDYVTLEHNNKHTDVLLVAVVRTILDGYRKAFAAAGIELTAADAEALSLARLLPPIKNKEKENAATLVVDLGERTSTFLVIDEVGIRSSFTRFTAGAAMTEALATTLKIDPKKAEVQKQKTGLSGTSKTAKILSPFVDLMASDLRRAVSWHESHHESKVNRVFLVGGTSRMTGLKDRLLAGFAKDRNIETAHLTQVPFVTIPKGVGITKANLQLYTSALGASLFRFGTAGPTMDLLHPKEQFKKQARESRAWAGVASPSKKRVKKSVWQNAVAGMKALRTKKEKPAVLEEDRKERIKMVLAIAFVTLACIGLVVAFFVRQNRVRSIELEVSEILAGADEQSDEAEGEVGDEVVVPFTISPEDGADVMSDVIEAGLFTEDLRVDVEGGEVVDAQATGFVTLINESATAQPLVATTRLLSDEGVLFRLQDAVTVPANGEIEAEVYADLPGEEGEIDPSAFTIPGLSEARQQEVYATSPQQMTGGTVAESGELTDETILNAVQEFLAEVQADPRKYIGDFVTEDAVLLADLVEVEAVQQEVVEGSGVVQVTFEMTAHVFSRVMFLEYAKPFLAQNGVTDVEVGDDQLEISYQVLSGDVRAEVIEISAEISTNTDVST